MMAQLLWGIFAMRFTWLAAYLDVSDAHVGRDLELVHGTVDGIDEDLHRSGCSR